MPYPYGWGDNQGRDIGALANGLRQLEVPISFIVLDERKDIVDPEVQLAGYSQLSDPTWWKEQGEGTLLTIFGTSRMLPIYQAAKTGGWRIWTRMDCDGVPGPDGGFLKYIKGRIIQSVDNFRRSTRSLSGTSRGILLGAMRGVAGVAFAKQVRNRLWKSFSQIDKFLVETIESKLTFGEYFYSKNAHDFINKIEVVPPAISEKFTLAPGSVKSNVISSIGQWWRYQKNVHLLADTINHILSQDSSLRWIVAGDGVEIAQKILNAKSNILIYNRVDFQPYVQPSKLLEIYTQSKLIFYSSRQEGFPNTLCEALCCGARFVGPRGIQAFDHCEKNGWGITYKPGEAGAVLSSEIHRLKTQIVNWDSLAIQAASLFHRKRAAEKVLEIKI